MSFDQRSFDDKIGVNADSFSAQPSLQHMSRRCIMSLSVKAASIVGLASSGLFCTNYYLGYSPGLPVGAPTWFCLTRLRLTTYFVI
jgi:hypothetical protein